MANVPCEERGTKQRERWISLKKSEESPFVLLFCSAPLKNKKKMIILQKETEEHRDAWTSAPQGEPGTPPTVLTPHSPSTIKRAAGVGTLYWDTIYASAAETYVTTPFCGGSSLPSR